jgi:hypothetical protein
MLADLPRFRAELLLLALALLGGVVYVGTIAALFGRAWFSAFAGRRKVTPPPSPAAVPPPSD